MTDAPGGALDRGGGAYDGGPWRLLSDTIKYRRATRFFDPGNYDISPPQIQEKTAETGDGAPHQAVHAE